MMKMIMIMMMIIRMILITMMMMMLSVTVKNIKAQLIFMQSPVFFVLFLSQYHIKKFITKCVVDFRNKLNFTKK